MDLRLSHIAIVLLLAFTVLWARLAQLMVLEGPENAAAGRRVLAHSLAPTRGTIYTADGLVLAEDRPGWDLMIRFRDWGPRTNGNLIQLARRYGLGIDGDSLHRAMTKARRRLETDIAREIRLSGRDSLSSFQKRLLEQRAYELIEDVPEPVWQAVCSRPDDFPGLEPRMRPRRTYPQGHLASHVTGYVSRFSAEDRDDHPYLLDLLDDRSWMDIATDSELQGRVFFPADVLGRTGLENRYESDLRGWRGVRVIAKEIIEGRRTDRLLEEVSPTSGWAIHTTLDSRWQQACEDSLAKHCGPRGGGCVILEAGTGAVLSLASWPSPEAGRITRADLEDDLGRPLINKCVQDQFPLASVFKIVTGIAALEEGIETHHSRHDCTPAGLRLPGTPRQRCWIANQYNTGHGPLRLDAALAQSCNIWFFRAGISLGHARLHKWSRMFGFGQRTGIDLPGEARGHLPTRSRPEITNFAIGSGNFSGTILQAARLMALVATEGRPITPHLVSRGRPKVPPKMPVAASTWSTVRDGLRGAVTSGTARNAILQRLNVLGKTGTAQLGPQRQSHLWFAGFTTLKGRRIAFALCLLEGGDGDSKAPAVMAEILEAIEKDAS